MGMAGGWDRVLAQDPHPHRIRVAVCSSAAKHCGCGGKLAHFPPASVCGDPAGIVKKCKIPRPSPSRDRSSVLIAVCVIRATWVISVRASTGCHL